MALGLTSVAIVTNTAGTAAALTSGAFTPPASSLLLPLWAGNSIDPNDPGTPTATDSLSPTGVWTLNDWQSHADSPNADGQAAIFRAFTPRDISQTVTVNNNAASPNRHAALGVQVITGADFANPIGQHGKAGSKSTTTAVISHTPTRDGSRLFIAASDWTATGVMTVSANLTLIGSATINVSDLSYGFAVSANPGVRGVTANYTITFGGTSLDASWVFVEVLPDVAPSLNRARTRAGYSPLWRPGKPRRRTVRPQFSETPPIASPVPFDTSGVTVLTASATSAVVDISTAADGAWCYAWANLSVNSGAISATGWTDPSATINADEGTSAHYALLRRKKQPGDSTFTFSWTTSGKGVIGWVSYTGLDPTTPDEQAALVTNGSTSRVTAPTPSATPTAANRWAVAFHGVRSSTAGNKPIFWFPDPALFERVDIDNNAGSSPWSGIQIADSPTVVTAAAHTYTGLHNAAESHDGSAILFLIPAGTGTNAPAESPAATGVASDASTSITTSAIDAGATGVAADGTGSVGASPATPAGTGTASDIGSVASTASPDTPAGTGSATDGNSAITVNAEAPSATGQAFDATVSTASAANAPAEAATSAGTADNASIAIASNPDTPIGAGTALDASSALTTNAGQADATGVAADGTGSVGASPATASGTGAATDTSSAVTVNPDTPTGTGTAFDATVQTSGSANAPAEAALGTGAAQDPTTAITSGAGAASAAGTSSDAAGSVGASPDTPGAIGTAPDPGTAITVGTQTPTGSGTAGNASADIQAGPGIAQAVGTAFDATVGVYAVGVALAAGQAFDAAVALVPADIAPPHIDAVLVVGAVMAVVVSPGEPVPVLPGHHARVSSAPASGPDPLPVVGDVPLAVAPVR